jgi:HlyD family secretion protein
MKIFKVLAIILVMAAIIAALPGCGAKSTATPTTQEATVTKGNLVNTISASGNLAFSQTQDMAVDLFYPTGTKGTIGEVLVQVGNSVKKGQVLATIDKSEWNDQLSSLEGTITAKGRALVQAQINLANAQQAIVTANEAVVSRQSSVLSAQISLANAQNTLNAAILNIDFVPIAATLNKAKAWYEYVTVIMPQAGGAVYSPDYDLALQKAKQQLDAAQAAYDNAVAGYNTQDVSVKQKQVQLAQYALTAAQSAVTDAQNDIPLKQLNLTLVQGNLQDAQKALDDAKTNLTVARSKSPEIVAPFDGIITAVNVAGGDQVLNGTIATSIADPSKFVANILVSEMDIPKVAVGGVATVVAQSAPTSVFTATVSSIAPTATISSGVVNYSVKVEVQAPVGNLSGQFGQSGNSTRPSSTSIPGNIPRPSGTIPASGLPSTSGNQAIGGIPATSTTTVELRQGLTVTVSVIVANRTNVLMVPKGAVTTEGANKYVQVIDAAGKLQKTQVTTGISNLQYTEIASGLTEGQKISITLGSTANKSSSVPGIGGIFGGR